VHPDAVYLDREDKTLKDRVRHLAAVAAINAGIVGGLYALEPALVTDTVRSPRALAVVAVTVVACMVLGRVGRRWGGSLGGAFGAAVPLALVGWLVVAPAVRDDTLVEALPSAAVPSAPSPTLSPTPASATSAPTATAAQPTGPTKVSTGRVRGIGHTASGTVALYRLADGSHLVRFEDVAIEGSPDPVLWLVPGSDRESRDGGTKVGSLKATHGTFHHDVPASFDLTQDFTVFVWCDRFATPIAGATIGS